MTCGEKVYSTETDRHGTYRLFVPEKGKCQMAVRHGQETLTREVISFEDSTRYDLAVERDGGRVLLRRQ